MKKTAGIRPPKIEPATLASDEIALFRATVGAVQALPEQNRIAPTRPTRRVFVPCTAPAVPLADTLSDFTSGEIPDEFLSNGFSRMTLRKLRRGTWPVEDRLDLHGYHSDAARMQLQAFLHDASQHGLRCVLVIHGKGMNSKGGEAILKLRTRHWLMQHPGVLAYCDAPIKEGGNGAVVILLKAGS